MISVIAEWLSIPLLAVGIFLVVSGGVGLLRFPDTFCRMHAAGVTETLASGLILLGLMLLAGWGIAAFKLVLILLFLLITGPTASHTLAKAALHGGMKVPDNKEETS